jgi:formylglycine-generating enzyme required for sulfatase activity
LAQAAAAIAELGGLAPDLADRLLQRRLAAGTCLLLLDGLDEVTESHARGRVLAAITGLGGAYAGRNQVLVTCRTAGFEDQFGGWVVLAVQRFGTAQIRDFVRHWFAAGTDPEGQTAGLLAALGQQPGLHTLAATPLLLALIVRVYEDGGRLPASRVALYRQVLQNLTHEWNENRQMRPHPRPQHYDGAVYHRVARELAAGAHAEGLRVIDEATLLGLLDRALAVSEVQAAPAAFLNALMQDTGLLRRLSATGYDFAHLTVQEYLTAEAIQGRDGADALLARAGAPWWREVIRFYAGLTQDPAGLIARLLPGDPLLAAGCLADARLPPGVAAAAVADPVIAVLVDRLGTDPDGDRRQSAADTLAEIGGHGAREHLELALAGSGQDPVAGLAALLALAPGNEAGVKRLAGGLGALLRCLHGGLPGATAVQRGRILALLETLGYPLCLVPAGPFRMGTDTGGSSDERPAHEVRLTEYWIDRYPVTNRQFEEYAADATRHGGAWRDFAGPKREDHPVVAISWDEATAYGAWCGKRLPTEAEWEKAARGTKGRRYPWGDRWDADCCNTDGLGTSSVFAHPKGASPYGCQDMAGNVWEWCADWYQADWYRQSPSDHPTGPESGVARVVRGGSWFHYPDLARAASRNHFAPHFRIDSLGCRLVCGPPIR